MRIDKFAAEQTGISRADAKALIKRRQIIVNGSPVMSGDVHIDPENDEIIISGKHINYREHLYIMMNKPAGTVCAVKDELVRQFWSLSRPSLGERGFSPQAGLTRTPRALCSSPTTESLPTECYPPAAMWKRNTRSLSKSPQRTATRSFLLQE